jgi:hypothetical protein
VIKENVIVNDFYFSIYNIENMKKLLFVVLALTYLTANGQIVFESDHDSSGAFNVALGGLNGAGQLTIVNFEVSGDHYVNINKWGKYISIYDMNHALTKTISLAGLPMNTSGNTLGDIMYLSEHLFNTDSKIEFMYVKDGGSLSSCFTGIYNESGVLLFSDTASPAEHLNIPFQQVPIYNSTTGTKMILSYSNGHAKVFGLGGTLTTGIEHANQSILDSRGKISNPYPNPTNASTVVDYKLPDGINEGTIIFYDLQGNEVKRFRVDRTFSSLLISTSDISAGTYYYQLQTSGNNSPGKKLVVIK